MENRDIDPAKKAIILKLINKWKNICVERRADNNNSSDFRIGPAPADSPNLKKPIGKSTYGTLDSDVDDLEFSVDESDWDDSENRKRYSPVKQSSKEGYSLASCRSLIMYFSKLGKGKNDKENIEMKFLDSMFSTGADVNFQDKHGQSIMHEIARAWHPNVLKFIIEKGGDINKADYFGRSPLHLAAAMNYADMVEFLIKNGAKVTATTIGEKQTPLHYAAKNNAISALKVLMNNGAYIADRDYRQRTPLFVCVEAARADAALFLLEKGAPVGVYDDTGTPCLSLMIEKMPHVALEAVKQFRIIDRAFRKDSFFLSFLERDPKYLPPEIPRTKAARKEQMEREQEMKRLLKEEGSKETKEDSFAKTPLEVIIQYGEMDLIMHSVFQRLLKVKWDLFGKKGVLSLVAINVFYTLIWTLLGILLPRDGKYYAPLTSNWWRIILEITGVGMTVYFMCMELRSLKYTQSAAVKWRQWRMRQIERDLKYCHPRWPAERQYLESELKLVKLQRRTYFSEIWNVFEWITYVIILALVITRIVAVSLNNKVAIKFHAKTYAVGLVVIWLRLMRTCRAIRSLGPFIAILGSVIIDTLKFSFLFFEFFIPYSVGFWILFGGEENSKIIEANGQSGEDWLKFHDLVFSTWQMTLLMVNFETLAVVDRFMAQILTGTYFALTAIVCLNLYIALLSDTFARLYSKVLANAVMQQAQLILAVENSLSEEKKTTFGHYMQNECSPLVICAGGDDGSPEDEENDTEVVVRQVGTRINEMQNEVQEFIRDQCKDVRCRIRYFNNPNSNDGKKLVEILKRTEQQSSQIVQMNQELNNMKTLISKILDSLPPPSSSPALLSSRQPVDSRTNIPDRKSSDPADQQKSRNRRRRSARSRKASLVSDSESVRSENASLKDGFSGSASLINLKEGSP